MEPLFQDQCVSLHTTAQYGGHDYDDCHSPCHFTTIKMVVNVADFIQRHAHIVHTSGCRVKKKLQVDKNLSCPTTLAAAEDSSALSAKILSVSEKHMRHTMTKIFIICPKTMNALIRSGSVK